MRRIAKAELKGLATAEPSGSRESPYPVRFICVQFDRMYSLRFDSLTGLLVQHPLREAPSTGSQPERQIQHGPGAPKSRWSKGQLGGVGEWPVRAV